MGAAGDHRPPPGGPARGGGAPGGSGWLRVRSTAARTGHNSIRLAILPIAPSPPCQTSGSPVRQSWVVVIPNFC